ncbi:MAG: LmeA family phospholipid-binding protein, partial [Streptosporangiaceae bacterium]
MYQYQPPKRSAGRKALIWIISILALLVALDFGAKAFAESEAASQIQKQGFPKKPDVSIAGFPFHTQVITRNFHQVTISSSDIPEGPIKITSLNVVAQNVKLHSNFQSGTAGPLNGTVLISLGAIGGFLSDAGPLAGFLGGGSNGGLKVVAVGGDEVRASLHLVGGAVNASATWTVVPAGPHASELHLVNSSGLPGSFLYSARNVKIP